MKTKFRFVAIATVPFWIGAACSGPEGPALWTPPVTTGPDTEPDAVEPGPGGGGPTDNGVAPTTGSPNGTSGNEPGAPNAVDPNTSSPGVSPTPPDGSGVVPVGNEQPTPQETIEPGDPIPLQLSGSPTNGRFVRLSHKQWENSVQYLLALSAPLNVSESFAADAIVGSFSTNEKYMTTTETLISDYERAIEALVEGLNEQSLQRIYPGTDAAGFISTFGRRAYRRPLTQGEVDRYMEIYTAGTQLTAEGSEFVKGAGLVIQTMLQSPYFIYRTEFVDDGQPLTGYEVASKLSLAILDVTPDDTLLDAAGRGELDGPDGLANYAAQLLEDPRALTTMRRFHGEALQFKRFNNVGKDPIVVPEFTAELPAALLEGAYRFFDRIFDQDLGVRDIFTSTVGFVNADLAPLYGVNPPAFEFQEMDLGPERTGYFSQAPYLIMHSVNLVPDSIHRGVDLNLKVLCAQVDSPDFVPPGLSAPQPDESNRELIEKTTGSGICAGCHQPYINPLGFAFENFDGMGRWRDEDRGKPVDASASYPFIEGTKSFADNAELMQIMADSKQAHECYSKNMLQFVLARELTPADMPTVESLATTSMAQSSIKDLVVEVVKTPAFRTRSGG